MSQMSRLTYNEIQKILHQRRIVVVVAFMTLVSFFLVTFAGSSLPHGSTAATLAFAFLGRYSGFVIPCSMCLVLGDIVAGEMSAGTIKLLMVRPLSRWKIWLSKYFAALLASWALLLYAFVVSYLVIGFKLGFGHWSDVVPADLTALYPTAWAETWRTIVLNALAEASLVSLIVLLSTVVNSGVAGIGVSFGVLLLGGILSGLAQNQKWPRYLIFQQLDPEQYLTRTLSPVDPSLAFSLTVLVGWLLGCAALGVWLFQRRDILA